MVFPVSCYRVIRVDARAPFDKGLGYSETLLERVFDLACDFNGEFLLFAAA